MKILDLVALIVTLSGCGTLSEQRFLDENARLLSQQQFMDENARLQDRLQEQQMRQARSINELTALSNQLVDMHRRLEYCIRLVSQKQDCELMSREIGDPAVRNQAIASCLAGRGFRQDCQ